MKDTFFEWDDDKALQNERDHGIAFKEARSVFQDPGRVELYDEGHSEEGRYVAIGFSHQGQMLFVVFIPRDERIRLISARVAEADEEKVYEKNN